MGMAPHGDAIGNTFTQRSLSKTPRPPSNDAGLHRTISDISFQLSKEAPNFTQPDVQDHSSTNTNTNKLAPISEVEVAACECCGMSEECTPEYIERVRGRFLGKWVCGLCAEAVIEEKEKLESTGKKMEEALSIHMNACVRFNRLGRAYPVLFQAEAMREMLKKSYGKAGLRAKSFSPRDHKGPQNKAAIARSSSCIPAITREMNNLANSS